VREKRKKRKRGGGGWAWPHLTAPITFVFIPPCQEGEKKRKKEIPLNIQEVPADTEFLGKALVAVPLCIISEKKKKKKGGERRTQLQGCCASNSVWPGSCDIVENIRATKREKGEKKEKGEGHGHAHHIPHKKWSSVSAPAEKEGGGKKKKKGRGRAVSSLRLGCRIAGRCRRRKKAKKGGEKRRRGGRFMPLGGGIA